MLFCLVGFTGGHARNYQNALRYGRNFFEIVQLLQILLVEHKTQAIMIE